MTPRGTLPAAPSPRATLIIVVGAMLALSLGVMDASIVGTAGPTIISDLGGLNLYTWVFSVYVLAQTTSMPLLGKLSDIYGRKRFFLAGLVVFIAGSMLSGASQNIYQLIAFRALQGLGSGAFFTVGLAIVGASVKPEQRSRVLGITGSVFGLGAIMGPTVGSYLVQSVGWRWIFYVNLPFGVASLLLLTFAVREVRGPRSDKRIDWTGAVLLAGWVSTLLLGMLNGGTTYPWYSWQEALFFGGFVVLLPAFLYAEGRAGDPIIPLDLFRIRMISLSFAIQFVRGGVLLGLTAFISLFVQGALGGNINDTRNVLYAFVFPFIVGSIAAGQLLSRLGYKVVALVGVILMAVGTGLFAFVGLSPSVFDLIVRAPISGLGMGVGLASVLSAFQNSVDRRQIGVASSLSTFSLNLGGAIGVSLIGTIQLNSFSSRLTTIVQGAPSAAQPQLSALFANANQVGQLLNSPAALAQIVAAHPAIEEFVPSIRAALAGSILDGFLVIFAMSVISVVAALFMPASAKRVGEDAPKAEKGGRDPAPPA
ncbi:MAG TPA: MFS transporter [Nitrososphaerales archaeon]|nr:MFS transporter [Nitrososphaerales archaeon]